MAYIILRGGPKPSPQTSKNLSDIRDSRPTGCGWETHFEQRVAHEDVFDCVGVDVVKAEAPASLLRVDPYLGPDSSDDLVNR
jgi:hypothetical protein